MSGGGEEGETLEFTPTWVVAAVCTVIVAISLAAERFLHFGGKFLKAKDQKPLYEALQKIKEELMLLGFISLLLTVTQNGITKICVPPDFTRHMLPCSLDLAPHHESHFQTFYFPGTPRRLLAAAAGEHAPPHSETEAVTETGTETGFCARKNKVPLLSVEALHHLHIFIFVLAVVHVTFSVLTVVFGGARIRQWKHWEDSIAKQNYETDRVLKPKVTVVQQHDFIRGRFSGFGKDSAIVGWMISFSKQFYGSVTKSDYVTLRHGFIMLVSLALCGYLLVAQYQWYAIRYKVMLLLLLAVGTKLEHVITQLAHEVAEKHAAIEGDLVVQPSDEHFWFHRPRVVLFLIHFILFQNAFEIAFFFWIWLTYGFDSCIMGQVRYIIPRLVIGVFIQVLCSYSTLPLYAIVTQMGTHYKRAIFNEHLQHNIVGWAQKAKKRKELKADGRPGQGSSQESGNTGIQLGSIFTKKASAPGDTSSAPKDDGTT
ncbi:mlo protein [Vigna unguiculata]|uniref:MLO-like protein n=1 Tax=Vigna unguiculata TaxID=3917 RepID=A0A4D6NSW8_VIGUN|nr:mlo protein [Vigna unguiculata]